jgi:hypothetical protein
MTNMEQIDNIITALEAIEPQIRRAFEYFDQENVATVLTEEQHRRLDALEWLRPADMR